jgi:ketosteroid isomerase-like protein
MALGVTSACAPIQPVAAVYAQNSGEQKMNVAQTRSAVATEASFRDFLVSFEEGTSRFINGDPTLWKENASHSDEATIMGGWGAYEQGWEEVGPRYDWAAARFVESGARVEVEYLAIGVSGSLAYTVANERSKALIIGQDQAAAMALRVTHIFGWEDGAWKLLHRHADPLMEKTAPDTVLQK